MQITIDTHELNAEQLGYLEGIIRVRKEIYMGYEKNTNASKPVEPVVQVASTTPYQPELPFEGAVINTSMNDKPKRGRKPKEAVETSETVEVVSEVVQEEIVASDAVSVTHSDTKTLTLSDVKAKAQDLVQKVSRDAVKNTINKYADKISEVKESDYPALMADFEALEG